MTGRQRLATGRVERIGQDEGMLTHRPAGAEPYVRHEPYPDHETGMTAVVRAFAETGLALERLSFYLGGPDGPRMRLYEQLSAQVTGIVVRPGARPVPWQDRLPLSALQPAGLITLHYIDFMVVTLVTSVLVSLATNRALGGQARLAFGSARPQRTG